MILVSQKGCHSGLPRLFTAQGASQGSEQARHEIQPALHSPSPVPWHGLSPSRKAVPFSICDKDTVHLVECALGSSPGSGGPCEYVSLPYWSSGMTEHVSMQSPFGSQPLCGPQFVLRRDGWMNE